MRPIECARKAVMIITMAANNRFAISFIVVFPYRNSLLDKGTYAHV